MRRRRGSAFTWIILGLLIVTLVYLMVDVGSSGDVFSQYESVKGGKSSSFSRRVIFLNSYIEATGDLSIANTVGLSSEEMQQLYSSGYRNYLENVNTKFPSGSVSEQINTLKTDPKYNNSYYSSYIRTVTLKDGSVLGWEEQTTRGAWSSYKPSSSSMASAGCFYYATCALIGAKKGDMYTIERLLNSLGGSVSVGGSGEFVVSGKPITSLAGSDSQLSRCLAAAQINATVSIDSRLDESGLRNGSCMYIVYQYAHPATSGNCTLSSYHSGACSDHPGEKGYSNHWTAVVGMQDDMFIVLGNGSRSHLQPSSAFVNISHYYKVTFK